MDFNLGILGCGKLGESILSGLLAADPSAKGHVQVTCRKTSRAKQLREVYGVTVAASNEQLSEFADLVLLCVKPAMALEATRPLGGALKDKSLCSVCAGVRLSQLDPILPDTALIRAMPNTPAQIQQGMTVLSEGPRVRELDVDRTRSVFQSVGRVLELDEKHLDVVTGLSGSGPAFAMVMIEALADGGVMMGLPRDAALELAAQTMQGASRLVLETGQHPAALKDDVTTPAGSTIAGLLMLEDGRIRSTLARAIQETTRVASGLGGASESKA
ncbi:MAG: pyrroline-5-carboxylate reductase [Planctomycetota bacterium]